MIAVNAKEAIKLYDAGATFRELAERYGVTKQRVHQVIGEAVNPARPRLVTCRCGTQFKSIRRVKCEKCRNPVCHGCGAPTRGKLCERCAYASRRKFDRSVAERLYQSGQSLQEIAAHLGVQHDSVYRALMSLGVKMRRRGPRGPRT